MIKISTTDKNNIAGLRFIDLFAGIGGFHLALSSFGAKCVFTSEWDKYAQEVYSKNFKASIHGDITKIKESEIPSHDILCAGFPCQAFSISGKQRGFEDTRGTLFFDIARIAKKHKPKILLLENVANFAKHDNGNTLNTILKTLDKIGYDTHYKVLNASDYGLPQRRQRIYFVCFLKELKIKNFDFPKQLRKSINLQNIILHDKLTADYIISRKDIKLNKNSKLEPDIFGDILNQPIRIGTVNKGGQGERIYHELGHAITLSAYGGGVGAKTGLYLINEKIRKLAPRECARLQGFPDNFIIHDNKNQAYKQFGNSVAVNVLQYILKEINKSMQNG